MDLNKVMIIGRLTRDPELKSLSSGTVIVNFSVATNRTWRDKSGQKQEGVEYHNVVAFGRTAENVNQYMKKGSGIYVECRIQTRSWDGADGKKNYRTEIIADRVQFGPKKEGVSQMPSIASAKEDSRETPPVDTIDYPEENVNVDDIPF